MTAPSAPRPSFTALVRAEDPARQCSWHARDTVAVLAVPAIFAAGWVGSALGSPTVPGPHGHGAH